MEKYLSVVKIGDLKESNSTKGDYRQVWFKPINYLQNGQKVFSNQAEKSRIIFGPHDDSAGDPLFQSIQAGEIKEGTLIEGGIYKFDTTEYQPEGYDRPVSSYTCVVFSNEDPIKYANRQLKNNYACVIDVASGMLTAEQQLVRPTSASTVRV